MELNEFLNQDIKQLEKLDINSSQEMVSSLESNVNWNQTSENLKRYGNPDGSC